MKIKKILALFILLLTYSLPNYAQSVLEQLKQKELEQKNVQKTSTIIEKNKLINEQKQTIKIGSAEYDELKSKKLLKHYELKIENGKIKPISLSDVAAHRNNSSTSTYSLTPCDVPPVQGVQPWPAPTNVDDQNTSVSLPFTFCFYGQNYTSCNVSINGNIQFGTSNSTAFSSVGFPTTTVKMIAPFWSDPEVNISSGGIYYGHVYIDMYPTRMVVSWDSMGYYSNHADKLNSFQCVITDGTDPLLPPGKNVGFYYRTMQWTTGDASDGLNGFPDPTITPATPATVGANEGNGTDYFLIGRFGQPGSFYDGPLGADDGVSWLDNKKFFFNVCPPAGSNQEPVSTLIGYCDTLKVCGNDTLYVKNTFIGPEVTQTVSVSASAPSLGSSFSYSTVTNGNSTDIYMIIDGSSASSGYHTITMTATDNGTPVQTSVLSYVVYIDQNAINNLNGQVVITPTLGACPGSTITASVSVNGGAPDSYFWSNNAITSSTSYTTANAADSIVFVTITSGQCQKTLVDYIHIKPTPVVSISGNLSLCSGITPTTVLTATNTFNASQQAPYTYSWSGTGTLSPTNTQTTVVNQGVYTVTLTNQFGCSSIGTTTVIMNEGPSYTLSTNAISGGSVYCSSQDSARIAFHYTSGSGTPCSLGNNTCISPNTYSVGNGTSNSSATATTPYANLWGNSRHQYLFLASELSAAGVQAGKLSSIAFNISSVSGTTDYPDFTIKMKCTNANALTSTFDDNGLTQVYTTSHTNITTGWNTYNFPQAYLWDGTSNILIDVCHSINPWTNSSAVLYTTTSFNSVTYDFDDDVELCGNSILPSTNKNRPNIQLGNCSNQQFPAQFNVAVTPTTGVIIPAGKDSIKINLPAPGTSICYTISVINPIGGCEKDTIVCVMVPGPNTDAQESVSPGYTICSGSPVTMSASGGSSYIWYEVSTPTSSTVIGSNSSVTTTPPSVSSNTYIVKADGFCGSSPDYDTLIITTTPKANLTIAPISNITKCLNTTYTIQANAGSSSPGNPGTPYSYSWALPGGSPAPGNNSSSTYTTNSNATQTLIITVTGNCANSASATVIVSNYANNLAPSISDSASICTNSAFTLNSIIIGGVPPYSFNWSISPNNSSIGNNSFLNFTSPNTGGVYSVTLNVVDSCGYTGSDVQLVNVMNDCEVMIPNVITPNGDGVNDFFLIRNLDKHPNSILTIYDRWGRKVYENSDYQNNWKADGVSDGTFFYVLDVPDDKAYHGYVSVFHGK